MKQPISMGLMQPYFFPYLGYFELIHRVDLWVVLDVVQYIRRGWMNRNRILHPTSGWQYINVPVVKHRRDDAITRIHVSDTSDWRGKLSRQFVHYQPHANHFETVRDVLSNCLDSSEPTLNRLNVHILSVLCEHLEIPFRYLFLSEMGLSLPTVSEPDEWALNVCQALGAGEYVNPSGGHHLYSQDRFSAAGITLTLLEKSDFTYRCAPYTFVPDLSILDAMMWNSKSDIQAYLQHRVATPRVPSPNTAPTIQRHVG